EQRPGARGITGLRRDKTHDGGGRANFLRENANNRDVLVRKHVAEIQHADFELTRSKSALHGAAAIGHFDFGRDLLGDAELYDRFGSSLAGASEIGIDESDCLRTEKSLLHC